MAYAIVKPDLACTGSVRDHRSEFLIDSENDLVNITEKIAPGSVAKMADGSKEFVMSPSKEWVEQVSGGDTPAPQTEPYIIDLTGYPFGEEPQAINSTTIYKNVNDAINSNRHVYVKFITIPGTSFTEISLVNKIKFQNMGVDVAYLFFAAHTSSTEEGDRTQDSLTIANYDGD